MNAPRYEVRLGDRLCSSPPRFRFRKKWHSLSADDLAVRRFLRELEKFLQEAAGPASLLAFRDDFRTILREEPIEGLRWCVLFGGDISGRIAVWLLGRLRYHFTLPVIADRRYDENPAVRRQVAKAFLRLGAWAQLREMEVFDRDPIVRRIAARGTAPPERFQNRLARFLSQEVRTGAVPRSEARSEEPRGVFLQATPGVGLPPKRPWFIHMILERIRRLVRGGAEQE